jgi:hypothetical protein
MSAPAESREAPIQPQPGELWSLWDMLKINAEGFYNVGCTLQQLEHSVDLVRLSGQLDEPISGKPETHRRLVDFATAFTTAAPALGANVTFIVAKRLLINLSGNQQFTFRQFSEGFRAVESAFRAELSQRHVYVMDERFVAYAEPKEPLFGLVVADKFPALAEDIENAGMCLALGQPTASVFHLMRAMEGAVGALCGRCSIPNPDREWGKLLSDLHRAIEAMPKGKERNAWSAAHANLYHVKQAWRNDTMHPKQTYTPDQAEHVFRAMRTFMAHLADLV